MEDQRFSWWAKHPRGRQSLLLVALKSTDSGLILSADSWDILVQAVQSSRTTSSEQARGERNSKPGSTLILGPTHHSSRYSHGLGPVKSHHCTHCRVPDSGNLDGKALSSSQTWSLKTKWHDAALHPIMEERNPEMRAQARKQRAGCGRTYPFYIFLLRKLKGSVRTTVLEHSPSGLTSYTTTPGH